MSRQVVSCAVETQINDHKALDTKYGIIPFTKKRTKFVNFYIILIEKKKSYDCVNLLNYICVLVYFLKFIWTYVVFVKKSKYFIVLVKRTLS